MELSKVFLTFESSNLKQSVCIHSSEKLSLFKGLGYTVPVNMRSTRLRHPPIQVQLMYATLASTLFVMRTGSGKERFTESGDWKRETTSSSRRGMVLLQVIVNSVYLPRNLNFER